MEDNKLIAEFMGADDLYDGMSDARAKRIYNYHTSWDCLMPVVKKCRLDSVCEYNEDDFWLDIHWALEECNLALTYKAVVEFIKNSNQTYPSYNKKR